MVSGTQCQQYCMKRALTVHGLRYNLLMRIRIAFVLSITMLSILMAGLACFKFMPTNYTSKKVIIS